MKANIATLALEKLIFIIWIKAYSASAKDAEIYRISIIRHK